MKGIFSQSDERAFATLGIDAHAKPLSTVKEILLKIQTQLINVQPNSQSTIDKRC